MSRKREREERPNSYNGRGGYESDNKRKKSGMNMKKVFAISFCIVLGIVFISGGVIYKLGHDLYSNVNYVADEDVKRLETLPEHVVKQMEEEARAAALEAESDVDGLGGVKVSADELDSIHNKMSSMTDKKTASDNDIYNILLVGVDRRDKTWNGNSDSMILVSINKKDNRVTMVSLMRDT